MGLNLIDAKVGTIVDHTFELGEDNKLRARPIRRRGIIMKTVGNGFDSVTEVHVLFKEGEKLEKVIAKELVRVYPASSRQARRAYARVRGEKEMVGAEFVEKAAPVRPKLQDSLGLTKGKASPFVIPEEGAEEQE